MEEFKIKTTLGSVGNTEWWAEKDWEEHRAYCDRLKAEGRFGEIVEHTVRVEPCDLLDKSDQSGPESYRMVIMDFSDKKREK